MRTVLLQRKLDLSHLQQSIRNQVKYHFVTPRVYFQGMDALVKDILN